MIARALRRCTNYSINISAQQLHGNEQHIYQPQYLTYEEWTCQSVIASDCSTEAVKCEIRKSKTCGRTIWSWHTSPGPNAQKRPHQVHGGEKQGTVIQWGAGQGFTSSAWPISWSVALAQSGWSLMALSISARIFLLWHREWAVSDTPLITNLNTCTYLAIKIRSPLCFSPSHGCLMWQHQEFVSHSLLRTS